MKTAINNAKAIYTGKLKTFHAPRLFHATPLIKKLTVFLAPHLFHAPCLFDTQEYPAIFGDGSKTEAINFEQMELASFIAKYIWSWL